MEHPVSDVLKEAKSHFSIRDSSVYTIIEIKEPFLNTSIVERYLLYPRNMEEPSHISATVRVGVPIKKVAINSTTHLGFIKELDQTKSIVAVSNPSLYYDSSFNTQIGQNKIQTIGERELNYEKLIKSEVDILFSFAINTASYKEAVQLRKLNQKVILISEYMEQDPILKAEWIKVFAAFYSEKEKQIADSVFKRVKSNYHEIKHHAMLYSYIPTVAIGLPWKGTWYVSGGNSFQAKLIRDANARYIWTDYNQTASVPLDIETALNKGLSAHFWINPGTVQSKNELESKHLNFKRFKSFESDKVFSNYLKSNELGANDYWESAIVRPDWILGDLVKIFHSKEPDSLMYYKRLQ